MTDEVGGNVPCHPSGITGKESLEILTAKLLVQFECAHGFSVAVVDG
jgi:hypothetical protein